jgi:hypothetical protein
MINRLLQEAKQICRPLDIALIKTFTKHNDQDVLVELSTFQNSDGGFGHGLEPDLQCPDSSVVATNVAVNILLSLQQSDQQQALIKDAIRYYIGVFDEKTLSFRFTPKSVDDYPHAIWWDYDKLNQFPYGNPNLEVIGFLLKFEPFVKDDLPLETLKNKAIDTIMDPSFIDQSMHTLLSAIRFFDRVDESTKSLVKARLKDCVNRLVAFDESTWDGYVLEPYKVYAITPLLFDDQHQEPLKKNLKRVQSTLNKGLPYPNWHWAQYDALFETIKHEWIGLITVEMLSALEQK